VSLPRTPSSLFEGATTRSFPSPACIVFPFLRPCAYFLPLADRRPWRTIGSVLLLFPRLDHHDRRFTFFPSLCFFSPCPGGLRSIFFFTVCRLFLPRLIWSVCLSPNLPARRRGRHFFFSFVSFQARQNLSNSGLVVFPTPLTRVSLKMSQSVTPGLRLEFSRRCPMR